MPQSPITSHPQGGIKWYENEPTMLTSVLRVLFASCSINHHQHLEVEAIGGHECVGMAFTHLLNHLSGDAGINHLERALMMSTVSCAVTVTVTTVHLEIVHSATQHGCALCLSPVRSPLWVNYPVQSATRHG